MPKVFASAARLQRLRPWQICITVSVAKEARQAGRGEGVEGIDKKPENGSVTKCKSGIAPVMDAPQREKLTFLAHSLRLWTLNALVFRAAKAGAVDSDA